MRRSEWLVGSVKVTIGALSLCAGLVLAGCGDDDDGNGPIEVDWPPGAVAYFDQFGILSADCETDEDCAMVLGYYHARDRWVQMDVRRRFSTGRLTNVVDRELVAAAGLLEPLIDTSVSNRALFSTREGRPAEEQVLENASPKTRALIDAYAIGVNQWLDDVRNGRNGAVWPRELESVVLDYGPEDCPDWTPSDSISTVLALIEELTNEEDFQVASAVAREEVGDDRRFADLWSNEPLAKSPILPSSDGAAARSQRKATTDRDALLARSGPVLRRLSEKTEAAKALLRGLDPGLGGARDVGSNNWALGPSLAAGDDALFCYDGHLAFSQPAIWYVAHLDAVTNGSGDIHTTGVTFAGLPWVIAGHNENVAWGATNTGIDFSDVYVEELVTDDGGQPIGVRIDGEVVEFVRVEIELEFNEGAPEQREMLFVPRHGPVRELDVENGVAITLRWTGQDASTDVNFLTEMAVAGDLEEARDAVANITTLGQNYVVIDSGGNFGWFPYSRIPKRTWATNLAGGAAPWLPLPGTGEFEWDEYFELDELPQSVNHPNGYIATANNDLTGALSDGDPTNDGGAPLQWFVAAGFRHARIAELIEASDVHTIDSMHAVQADVHSLIGEGMVEPILAIANDARTSLTPEARKVVDALTAWRFDCPTGLEGTNPDTSPLVEDPAILTEAVGCAAFHVALLEIESAIVDDERHLGYPNFAAYFSIVDPSQLNDGDTYWDDLRTPEVVESKYDITAAALDRAGRYLSERLGGDETGWAWGRIHTMRLTSDLSGLSAVFDVYNNPPPGEPLFSNDGGLLTVDVANHDRNFVSAAGASQRFCCDGPADCSVQLPGGQSSHVDSPNYDDLLDLWLVNQPIDLIFDLDRARSDARETVDFRDE